MNSKLLRRAPAVVANVLFIAAMFHPFRPSIEQGILGPLGGSLFFYLLIGWLFLLAGGFVFEFCAPWPSFNVLLALLLIFRPSIRFNRWVKVSCVILAAFSTMAAWRLADAVSTIPLILWSSACISAAVAIVLPGPDHPYCTTSSSPAAAQDSEEPNRAEGRPM